MPPYLPGAVMIDGRPALPVEPTLFQRGAFVMLWIGVAAVPIGFMILRAWLQSFGWLTIIMIIFGLLVMAGIQILLGAVAAANAGGFARKAMGTRAGTASLIYYGIWALIALTLPDFDDIDRPSPISRLIGFEAAFYLTFLLLFLALVAVIVTLAMISADAGRVRSQAIQNFEYAIRRATQSPIACGGPPDSAVRGQEFGERHGRPPGQ